MSERKLVLDVGQCDPDHASIRRLVEGCNGQVVRTHGMEDTLDELRREPFSLVLINRKLDADYSDGMEILRRIKQDPQLASIPVMLVSNYAEHQDKAVEEGAVPGFGKAELARPETAQRVKRYLV
ncbi:MAG TPA: response regulator [Pirellulales bacterium]|jgi:CheY-like chemotaxis protein|nr:response regulator [Pirellulales bacterium]